MRATTAEIRATETLRQNCQRRDAAFTVKRRVNGSWRGLLFHLGDEPQVSAVSRETRLLLVQALSRIVTTKWPLKRGPKTNAARTEGAAHGQQVEARRREVATGHGEGAAGAHLDLVAGNGVASCRADGERGGYRQDGHRASAPAAAVSRARVHASRGLTAASAGGAR